MIASESTFYVTGGTLRQDAACYVERQADKDLLDGLLKGEFCYVLTSRQMGKSSLMVRTAAKLREQGVQVVVLDLTAIGQNLTPEQWYDGLMVRMGSQLRLENELEEFWESHPKLGPCQRLFSALREVVLGSATVPVAVSGVPPDTSGSNESATTDPPRKHRIPPGETPGGATGTVALPSTLDPRPPAEAPACLSISAAGRSAQAGLSTGRLVIFVDELDVVRSLPFSTDEFFAAIRECYNRRTEDPEFNRLTFCLLGVATPSDLIRDTRTTPFNIGCRIELNDFTEAEAAPLAKGLENSKLETRNSKLLLQRILYWTGGHPYLTQRLCQAIAADISASGPAVVDRLCEGLFLSNRARERDDNLLFVRERLLRSEADIASLLHLYEQVRSHKQVRDDETNPLISILRLTGLTRVVEGYLWMRNRIYYRVFDREWIRANMPDAEVRRQKIAFQRGVIRATSIAAVLLVVVGGSALYGFKKSRLAQQEAERARRFLYAADVNLAHHAVKANNFARALDLLNRHVPNRRQEDLRGWEWHYAWQLCQGNEEFTLPPAHSNVVEQVCFAPDGNTLASAGRDGSVRLWDVAKRRQTAVLFTNRFLGPLRFSHHGRWLAFGAGRRPGNAPVDTPVQLWDVSQQRHITNFPARLSAHSAGLAFSPDDRLLAICDAAGRLQIWDLVSFSNRFSVVAHELLAPGLLALALAFSPDGKLLATGGTGDGTLKLWNVAAQTNVLVFRTHLITSLAFAPNGEEIATGGLDNTVRIWDIVRGTETANLGRFSSWVACVAYSPDGRTLAAAGGQIVRLWNTDSWEEIATLHGHRHVIYGLSFSPDGKWLATSGKDETIKFWKVERSGREDFLQTILAGTDQAHFSSDSRKIFTVSKGKAVTLRDIASGKELARFPEQGSAISTFALSPKRNLLAVGDLARRITVWDTASRQIVTNLGAHLGPINYLLFSSDGGKLFSHAVGGMAKVWDTKSWREDMSWQRADPGTLFVSPDLSLLAFAGNPLRLFAASTRHELGSFALGQAGGGIVISFSPDSKLVATGMGDGTAKVWDIANGQETRAFRGPTASIAFVGFSPDGKRLVTGDNYGRITLWDVNTGQEVAFLQRPFSVTSGGRDTVMDAVFSPDAKTFITRTRFGGWFNWRNNLSAETDLQDPGEGEGTVRQTRPRQEIQIDPSVLDACVGQYELSAYYSLTIRKEGRRLSGQFTGGGLLNFQAASETAFFARDTEINFRKAENGRVTGLMLVQAGQRSEGLRISDEPPPEPKPISLDPEKLERFVGSYALAPFNVITISNQSNRLVWQSQGGTRVELQPESESRFFATGVDMRVQFFTDQAGRVTHLIQSQNGEFFRQKIK